MIQSHNSSEKIFVQKIPLLIPNLLYGWYENELPFYLNLF